MQNKGIVSIMAALLGAVCLFYLSFSLYVNHHDKKAKSNEEGAVAYYESIAKDNVFPWKGAKYGYTLKECREREIGLGLDLKGGMNVVMEVSVADILTALAGDKDNPQFVAAIEEAKAKQNESQADFIDLFVTAFEAKNGKHNTLAPIFAGNVALQDKIGLEDDNDKVVKVLRKETDGAINNAFKVLRNRIDRFGVVQPNIQRLDQAGRILIELPGVKEPKRVEKLLQGSANLEFWETYENSELIAKLEILDAELPRQEVAAEEAKAETKEEVEAEAADASNIDALIGEAGEDTTLTVDEKAARAKFNAEHPLFAILTPMISQDGQPFGGPIVGMAHSADTATVMEYLRIGATKGIFPQDARFAWTFKGDEETGEIFSLVALKAKRDGACLTGDVITSAQVDFQQTSAYASVSMKMNSEGAKNWARITKDNLHRSIAIVLDGLVYSYPTVQSEITGGNSQITGNFTVEEAEDLSNTLQCGKMPAPAHIIQENIVGPSLGAESIKAGLISFIIAFCLILIYMIFYYGFIPGLIADTALLFNVFLIFGILCSFGSVLTLPGIAGIVLTLGMAVDANVLIFERIREEMKAGKGLKKAVEDGHKGAISAIVDANVTSLLTGIVLYIFGSGPIKGFAVTFIIGIITTFLTAVFFAHLLLDAYVNSKHAKEIPFTTVITKKWFQNTHINFVKLRFVAYVLSALVILSGLVGVFYPGLNQGIDFTGGRNYVVHYQNKTNTKAVREAVKAEFDKDFDGEKYTLSVITISSGATAGDENNFRISTNLSLKDNDAKMDTMLYEASKPFLAEDVTFEQFANTKENVGVISAQKVGPSIADDIKKDAVMAIIFALLIVALYILIRFRNVAYSVGALVSLAHDSFIIIGLYALCWKFMPFSMEIDQSFIAAILTVIGYSINDTVVIFDRIREYHTLYPKRERNENINQALNATLSRTFSTSMSTFVVLLAIFCFGGASIRGFVFALLLGVIVGTYSSLFIASPVAYEIQRIQDKFKAKKAAKAQA